MDPIISIRGLKKTYHVGEERVHALNGVDLDIYPGEFVCIIGRSGSGKSTLLNMMAGLEKPTRGSIVIAGEHLEKMNEKQLVNFRLEHIGFIFQQFNLFPYMTALENVAMPLVYRGVSAKKRLAASRKMLKELGLEKHMNHRPSQMSGGQQQRVGIARALVSNPEVIFADEPTRQPHAGHGYARSVGRQARRPRRQHTRRPGGGYHRPARRPYADPGRDARERPDA